jgi:hypothetical protein
MVVVLEMGVMRRGMRWKDDQIRIIVCREKSVFI